MALEQSSQIKAEEWDAINQRVRAEIARRSQNGKESYHSADGYVKVGIYSVDPIQKPSFIDPITKAQVKGGENGHYPYTLF